MLRYDGMAPYSKVCENKVVLDKLVTNCCDLISNSYSTSKSNVFVSIVLLIVINLKTS